MRACPLERIQAGQQRLQRQAGVEHLVAPALHRLLHLRQERHVLARAEVGLGRGLVLLEGLEAVDALGLVPRVHEPPLHKRLPRSPRSSAGQSIT